MYIYLGLIKSDFISRRFPSTIKADTYFYTRTVNDIRLYKVCTNKSYSIIAVAALTVQGQEYDSM